MRDPSGFRARFKAYKEGKMPYDAGRPAAIQEVDKSDADFAKRLRSNWRLEIWDWEGSGKAATHKMGSSDNIVYPNVQTTEGGGLIDFTNPIWKGVVDPRQRAILHGDFVPMKTESDAIWFGPNYKKYYPGFKNGKLPKYRGGKIGHNVSHAEMNDDGTFTDDYTKVFEDMYVTPQKTDLKRGSYTLNNFPYYLQHRTDWMKPFMSSGTNEKGLELVSPEFDLLLGGRQIATEFIPNITRSKLLSNLRKNLRSRKPAYKITEENAASMTPEQWTAAQDVAIAKGDMAEAQRLRDLHFKVSAPNTKTDVPLWTSSEETFNSFDLSHFGETDSGFFGYGHYLTPIEKYAASYHPVNRKFYVNIENPYIGSNDQYFNRIQYVKDRLAMRKENVMRNLRDGKLTKFSKKLGINENTSLEDAERFVDKYIADETVKWNDKYVKYADEFEGKDGVLSWRELQGIPNKQEGIYREVVVPRGEQIKSADAVTYDNSGVRIPLGKRDNFNINDIRYGLLPFGIGFGVYNNLDKTK